MMHRIHSCLDGEVPLADLSAEERARVAELKAVVSLVAGQVRAQPVPDLIGAVMGSLPAGYPRIPLWRRALQWWWTPHPIRLTLRPAYALAGVVALAFLFPRADRRELFEPRPAAMSGEAQPAPVYVQFRLEAPNASRVDLAGSFTGWQPRYELHETAPGVWSALVPLEPGVHDYAFVVDGKRWVVDPNAPQVADNFGGTNSRLSLPPLRRESV